jgi:hypothetical protein
MAAGIYAFVIISAVIGIAWSIYNYIKLKEVDLGP